MSGHSKWHSIRHKKGAADAKRGKIFTRHANLISIAARNGGDPDVNPALRLAIDNAKKENMPNDNIDRAIKKGTGEDKDGAQFEEILYEGYGSNGVAVLVSCLTDNRNRTVAAVRATFTKHGGNLGESGSVAFQFDTKGIILVENAKEADEMTVIEAGAEDMSREDDILEVLTDPKDLYEVKGNLEAAGLEISSASIGFIPQNTIALDAEKSEKIMKLLEALEDNDDVVSVSSNADFQE